MTGTPTLLVVRLKDKTCTITLGRVFRFNSKGCIKSWASEIRCWLEKSTLFMCLGETETLPHMDFRRGVTDARTEEGRESRPVHGTLAQ